MAVTLTPRHKALISHYIQAKDTNRPVYMTQAFAPDARLEMKVDTDAISFPPLTKGRDEISQLLVRNFGQSYDNVFTWCVEDSLRQQENSWVCQWLVCMTEKSSGDIRVGCGLYHWQFEGKEDQCRVQQLTIEIDEMKVLPPAHREEIEQWIIQPGWPWATRTELLAQMPAAATLAAF